MKPLETHSPLHFTVFNFSTYTISAATPAQPLHEPCIRGCLRVLVEEQKMAPTRIFLKTPIPKESTILVLLWFSSSSRTSSFMSTPPGPHHPVPSHGLPKTPAFFFSLINPLSLCRVSDTSQVPQVVIELPGHWRRRNCQDM